MNFASALFSLKRGRKIKRHHWTGYWCLGTKDSKKPYVEMHCYDGKIVNLLWLQRLSIIIPLMARTLMS